MTIIIDIFMARRAISMIALIPTDLNYIGLQRTFALFGYPLIIFVFECIF